jgi:hypothetical protein
MRLLSVFGAALILLGAPAPAAAQAAEEPKLDRLYLRYKASARSMDKLAACVVRRDTAGARAVFGLAPASAEQAEALRELFKDAGTCLHGTGTLELRTTNLMVLGSMAEELIRLDATPVIAPASPPIPPGGGSFEWSVLRLVPAYQPRFVPVAQCLLVRHPEWTRTLLAIDPVSRREREFYLGSAATLRDCIPEGSRMTLHPMYLRAALAMVSYSATRG